MANIEGFPLPVTSLHDEEGRHVPPHIEEWLTAADPESPSYDPNRAVRGREVELDQRRKAAFTAHLQEHWRRGEAAEVTG